MLKYEYNSSNSTLTWRRPSSIMRDYDPEHRRDTKTGGKTSKSIRIIYLSNLQTNASEIDKAVHFDSSYSS